MDSATSTRRIIELCLCTDQLARDTYLRMGEQAGSPEEASWWAHMALEEDAHCRYWEGLGALAEQGAVPSLFPDPQRVVSQLEEGVRGAKLLAARALEQQEITARLLAGIRMEFYMLHPAFEDLFHFGVRALHSDGAYQDYDHHLDDFLGGVERFGAGAPELAALGVTLSALWQRTRRMASQAFEDPLTGATNRRGARKVLHTISHLARRHGWPIGFAMVDIDDFKQVNDRFGHDHGDRVLQDVVARLQSQIRTSDLLARWGGEEFLVILPETPTEQLSRIGEKLRRSCAEAPIEGTEVTVSVGMAGGPIQGDATEALEAMIAHADARMYEAKRQGKDRVVA
jgi:diguanylate cyclase (GGDEF)-like protein